MSKYDIKLFKEGLKFERIDQRSNSFETILFDGFCFTKKYEIFSYAFNFRIPTHPFWFFLLKETYLLRTRLSDKCPQVATFHQLKQKIHGLVHLVCRYPEKSNNVWMAKLAKNRQLQNGEDVI